MHLIHGRRTLKLTISLHSLAVFQGLQTVDSVTTAHWTLTRIGTVVTWENQEEEGVSWLVSVTAKLADFLKTAMTRTIGSFCTSKI